MLIIRSGSNLLVPLIFNGIAAFDFAICLALHNSSKSQHISLNQLFTDVPGVMDSPLGNSDHSCISFYMKMGLKIPNITFSHKVYLKSCINWPCVGEDLHNFNRSTVYIYLFVI